MKRLLKFSLGLASLLSFLLLSSPIGQASSGEWSWPLRKSYAGYYEEGQQFGNTSFNRDGRGHYFHDGFDFGSAIYGHGNVCAVHDGQVLYAGNDPVAGGSLGDFIVIQAGGYNVIYQEFSYNSADIHVHKGQTVNKGQIIGNFTSSHLHLGITAQNWLAAQRSAYSDNGTWLDPIAFLQQKLQEADAGSGNIVTPIQQLTTNVHYGLHVRNGNWLPEVTNFNSTDSGFAGLPNHQHDLLYVRVDNGQLRYRVHVINRGWLSWVYKGDRNDTINGTAGLVDQAIDGVQLYYTTPNGQTLSQSYYRSQTTRRLGWLKVSADDGSVAGFDSFAGVLGEPLDRLQIGIASKSPF